MITFSRIINLLLILVIAYGLYQLFLAKTEGRPLADEHDRLFRKLGISGEPESSKIKIKRIKTDHANVDAWRVFQPEGETFWLQVQTPDTSSISPVQEIVGSPFSADENRIGNIFAHSYNTEGRSGSRLSSLARNTDSNRFSTRISAEHSEFLDRHWSSIERVDLLGNHDIVFPEDQCVPLMKFVVPENLRAEFVSEFGNDSDVIWDQDGVVLRLNCGTMKALRLQHHGSRKSAIGIATKLESP